MKPLSVCQEAHTLVNGARGETYGPPAQDFGRTAALWTALLAHKLAPGQSLTARDVPLLMIALKLSREVHQHKRDNLVDIAGYAETLALVQTVESEVRGILDELNAAGALGAERAEDLKWLRHRLRPEPSLETPCQRASHCPLSERTSDPGASCDGLSIAEERSVPAASTGLSQASPELYPRHHDSSGSSPLGSIGAHQSTQTSAPCASEQGEDVSCDE